MRSALFFILILAGTMPAICAEGLPTDDPTLRSYQKTTKEYLARCSNQSLSHVEESGCLQDQITALERDVDYAFKKKLKDANPAKGDTTIGDKSPRQQSAEKKSIYTKSQTAWKAYTSAQCGGQAKLTELSGGNGGDIDYAHCAIRHYVARLNELQN
ncbi:lysozyme inhibitor LprI family protein [Methylobacterium terrae]|nr:lysozyme inhibitor LprI family protein [Methylobacterium terrae]